MREFDVVIIGGGASGSYLAALFCDCRKEYRVALVDSNDRIGKKLSLTGNGQGNVSNKEMGAEHYLHVGTPAPGLVENIIGEDVLGFFDTLMDIDERGRIYPNSRQASSIVDLIRYRFNSRLTLFLGVKATNLYGNYEIELSNGEIIKSETLVICTGGTAQPRLGSDGSGFELIKKYGHTRTELFPGLVQLKTETSLIKSLRGKRVYAKVSLAGCNGILAERTGDLIFTEYGVTGDSIFGISPYACLSGSSKLIIDFFPDNSEDQIAYILSKRIEKMTDRRELFTGMLNNQLGRVICSVCDNTDPKALAHLSKNFTLGITGNLGFDNAQISVGGIPLSEVSEFLESKKSKGLYFAGEILDVSGECGGYNLHWAFASAKRVYCGITK